MADGDATRTNSSTRHVIEAMKVIAQSAEPLGLSEIAEGMNLPQSTAHRALTTLEESGFAKRVGQGTRLAAGDVVHHLIRSMVGLFPARVLLAPSMRRLSRDLDVTVSLNWRVGWHSMRLSSFEGARESYQIRRVGEARPLHSGVGPRTILVAQETGVVAAYVDWWSDAAPSPDIDPPDRAALDALAQAVRRDGRIRQEPTDYSALVWLSYPLRDDAARVQGSLSVGMGPERGPDDAFANRIDSRVDDIRAALAKAGERAASPFDRVPPGEIRIDQLKVLKLTPDFAYR